MGWSSWGLLPPTPHFFVAALRALLNLLSKKNDWELKNNTNFDSIVVLTGKFDRIKKGFELLEANYSKKMFISGVNPIVKKNELRKSQADYHGW